MKEPSVFRATLGDLADCLAKFWNNIGLFLSISNENCSWKILSQNLASWQEGFPKIAEGEGYSFHNFSVFLVRLEFRGPCNLMAAVLYFLVFSCISSAKLLVTTFFIF